MTFEFYHTTANPTGLAGTVGGGMTGSLVQGNLNELFSYVEAPPSGSSDIAFQYRKVHIKNAGLVSLTGVKLWLDAVEHTDQIHIGLENTSGQTVFAPTGSAPAGVTFSQPANYTGGVDASTFIPGYSTGVWIRQGLSGIHEPDPYASARLNVGGLE